MESLLIILTSSELLNINLFLKKKYNWGVFLKKCNCGVVIINIVFL